MASAAVILVSFLLLTFIGRSEEGKNFQNQILSLSCGHVTNFEHLSTPLLESKFYKL